MSEEQLGLVRTTEDVPVAKRFPYARVNVAGDIMTDEVKTLTLDHTVNAFIRFMSTYHVRHAPVIDTPIDGDQKPYMVGVVSDRDVLRVARSDSERVGTDKPDPKALRRLLTKVVTRNPVSVLPETSVPEVISAMVDKHIDMVPVMVNVELVGIITTIDVLKIFNRLEKSLGMADSEEESEVSELLNRPVGKIMTTQAACIQGEEEISVAIEVMQDGKFRHVVIVDEENKLIGIVSDRDILQHLPFSRRTIYKTDDVFRSQLFTTNDETERLDIPLMNIMTPDVQHVLPSCSVLETANMMRKLKVGCLPVVDERERILGVVTVTDIMRYLRGIYEMDTELVSSEK